MVQDIKIEEGMQQHETTPLLSKRERGDNDDDNDNDDKDRKRFMSTVALCAAMMVQSYLLISVFPYSGFLAMHLLPQLDSENVGGYAGYIASCFMVGRAVTSFEWGKATDRYGRKFAIEATLFLSAIFSIAFGFAPSFELAILFRFLLGLSNGMIPAVKTIISELNRGNEQEETKMMALVLGMWGYGFLLSPAISGYLSDPVKQYPESSLAQGPLRQILIEYPFVLPNIVAFGMCVISFVAVHYFVEETIPKDNLVSFGEEANNIVRKISSINLFKHLTFTQVDQQSRSPAKFFASSPSTSAFLLDSEGMHEDNESNNENQITVSWIWSREKTKKHLIVYWIYSFLVVALDETFPLFCMSVASGLGITESQIGNILTGSGLCYVLIQYFAVTKSVSKFGVYNAMLVGTFTSIPMASLLPFSLVLNRGSEPGELRIEVLVYLSVVYSIARVSSSIVFSTLTMTTNRTVPFHARATVNGFSMVGGSFGKALGPTFAGILFAFSASSGVFRAPFGSVFVFCIIGFMGLILIALVRDLMDFVDTIDDDVRQKPGETDQNSRSSSSINEESEEDIPTF